MLQACYCSTLTDTALHAVKRRTLVKQKKNSRDRESIQLWPRGANVCDFTSCCPAHKRHFDKNSAHCPDTDVRSFPGGQQQPYLETGRAGAGRWSCWRDILTFKVLVWYFSRLRGHIVRWQKRAYSTSLNILCVFQQEGLVEKLPVDCVNNKHPNFSWNIRFDWLIGQICELAHLTLQLTLQYMKENLTYTPRMSQVLCKDDKRHSNSTYQGIHLSSGHFPFSRLNLFTPANRPLRPRTHSFQVSMNAEIKRAPG